MQTFHIRYRNTQGTLMRILNAASRRGLDIPVVRAEPAENGHLVTLSLEVNQKQVGQLYREWYSIVDVIHVGSGAAHVLGERTPRSGISDAEAYLLGIAFWRRDGAAAGPVTLQLIKRIARSPGRGLLRRRVNRRRDDSHSHT